MRPAHSPSFDGRVDRLGSFANSSEFHFQPLGLCAHRDGLALYIIASADRAPWVGWVPGAILWNCLDLERQPIVSLRVGDLQRVPALSPTGEKMVADAAGDYPPGSGSLLGFQLGLAAGAVPLPAFLSPLGGVGVS